MVSIHELHSLTLFPWFPGELDPVATEVCWFVKLISWN